MQRLSCTLVIFALASGCVAPKASGDTSTDTAGDASASASASATSSDSGSGSASADGGTDDDAGDTSSASATAADSGESAGTSEGGDPECGVGAQCGEAAPEGWFGPAIYARAGEAGPPNCPEAFSASGPSVLEGWNDPGPAVCECSCELSAPLNCSAYTYSHSNSQCNSYTGYTNVTTACTNVNVSGWSSFHGYAQNVPSCMQSSNEFLPPPQWDAQISTCKLTEVGQACGDGDTGVCMPVAPEGFEAGLCIYKDGDNECPAGAYANKVLFHTSFEDTRSCTNCACGSAQAACSAPMQVFDAPDCEGNPVVEVPMNGACTQASGASVAMASDDDGGCPVSSPSEPMGAIAPVGPFTFCCQ